MAMYIAHRGDPIRHRENTIPAFTAAESSGADMIELDVQLSKDGKCVILHDDTLERLWCVNGAVRDLTYEEIRVATSSSGWEIPLLEDALRAVRTPVMVDVKYSNCIEPIVEVLQTLGAVDRVLFSGDNLEAHRLIRKHLPNAATALTWGKNQLPSEDLMAELKPHYLNPPWWLLIPAFKGFDTLGPDTVEVMHSKGTKVSVWTVDEVQLALGLTRLGVDAIISNRCREILQHVKASGYDNLNN